MLLSEQLVQKALVEELGRWSKTGGMDWVKKKSEQYDNVRVEVRLTIGE